MNGIKRSLLVSCLLLSVGSSIQQPLHAGRSGEDLQKILALVSNNKAALFVGRKTRDVARLIVLTSLVMLIKNTSRRYLINLTYKLCDDEFISMVTLQTSNYSFRTLKLLLPGTFFCALLHKEVLDLRTLLLEKKPSNFHKKMLNVSGRITKDITILVILTSFAMCMKTLGKDLEDIPQELKVRKFKDNDTEVMCPICHEDKKASELVNPCEERKHLYCEICIKQWYEHEEIAHKTCPLCRRPLMEKSSKSDYEKVKFILDKMKQFITSKKVVLSCGFLGISFVMIYSSR